MGLGDDVNTCRASELGIMYNILCVYAEAQRAALTDDRYILENSLPYFLQRPLTKAKLDLDCGPCYLVNLFYRL